MTLQFPLYDGAGPVRYNNGEIPKVGDVVLLDNKYQGVVIGVIDADEYEDEGYRSFSYIGGGILIQDAEIGLVAITDDRQNITLVSRKIA